MNIKYFFGICTTQYKFLLYVLCSIVYSIHHQRVYTSYIVHTLILYSCIYRAEAKKLQQQLDHFNSIKGQHEHIHQLLFSFIVNKSDNDTMKLNGQYMESCTDVFKGETFFISGFEPQVR